MSVSPVNPFPLEAYLNRIGFKGSPKADEETLRALHRSQVFSLPFENLNPWTGTVVRIDQEGLLHKMVYDKGSGRGGYCFELNQLFLLALQTIGFKTRPLCARVWRVDSYGPRSHQITLVEIAGKSWLADVGFGGNGLIDPLTFEPGRESNQVLDHYRIQNDETYGYRLECLVRQEWRILYAFSLDPFLIDDFQALNYYVSNSRDSLFTRFPMCMRPSETERRILYGTVFKVRGINGSRQENVLTTDALRSVLKNSFALEWTEPLPAPVPAPSGARPVF